MTREQWAEVVHANGQLPATIANALALAQYRARGQRLPVVRAGDVLVIPVDAFQRFYGALPSESGQQAQDAHRRR